MENHATYLLTWNPKKFPEADFPQLAKRLSNGKDVYYSWKVAAWRRISVGDRIFMLRQGVEPRGIIGSGWTTSDAFEGKSRKKYDNSRKEMFVDIEFDALLDSERVPILARSLLDQGVLGEFYWNTQSSGILIPVMVAAELERIWKKFLKQRGHAK
jgi:5-methylcytosine-specific restriction protein A